MKEKYLVKYNNIYTYFLSLERALDLADAFLPGDSLICYPQNKHI